MIYKAILTHHKTGYYNIGTGIGTSIEDQIKDIIDIFGSNNKIIYRPDKNNAPQYIMNITPAVKELDHSPKYNYISSLKDMKKEMELNRF